MIAVIPRQIPLTIQRGPRCDGLRAAIKARKKNRARCAKAAQTLGDLRHHSDDPIAVGGAIAQDIL